MKELLLACFFGASTANLLAQTDVKVWTRLAGTADYDFGYALATDGSGNVVIAGATRGSLGGAQAGRYDMFVGKYDTSGNRLWLAQRGTDEREFGQGVATDASGNIYVTGYTGSGLDGNTSAGLWDVFLMKFGPSGNWLWTKQDGTSQDDDGHAVATDTSGNVYITGYVRGNFHGNIRVGLADVFISKYNSAGTRLWSALVGSAGVDEGFGITCDASGNVYVTGYCQDSIEGNPYLGNGDNFLVKYNSNGQRQWLRQWGTMNADTGYSVKTDASGNVYVSGYTTGNLYGPKNGQRDVFLAKYDSSGNFLWGRQMGTAEHDQGWGVVTDASGNVYVAGETGDSLDGGTHQGGLDVFLAKYDSAGSRLWTQQFGTTDGEAATGITVDANGGIYLVGWTYGHLDGETNRGLSDVFLTKFAPANQPSPPPTANPASGVTGTGFTANWNSASTAVGYRLDVSTTNNFSSYLPGYTALNVGNVLSQSVTGLTAGTTYYYRVRAYNAYGTSGHSVTIAVTTTIPICTPGILLNGSFEGANSAGVGTNWIGYQRPPYPTTLWSIQTASPPAGAGFQYQQIANTSGTGGGGVRQNVTGCTIGATYVISGWMRGNSASATCTVKCSPSASTDWATAIHLNPPQTVSTNDWVRFSGTVVATGTNMTLWLDGQTGGTGLNKAACFDAVTVSCVVTTVPLRFESIGVSGQGQAQLALIGTAGESVTIQRSSNLVDWVSLTNLVNTNGLLQVTDPSATNTPQRFYRARSP